MMCAKCFKIGDYRSFADAQALEASFENTSTQGLCCVVQCSHDGHGHGAWHGHDGLGAQHGHGPDDGHGTGP